MFVTRVIVSLFEFFLSVFMSAVVIYMTYRVFIKANPDFDMEDEIKRGNVAVGTLVAAILFSASTMIQKGMDSVVSMFRMQMSAPEGLGMEVWKLGLLAIGHLSMSMFLAIVTISVTLRTFGKLTKKMEEGKELQRGNMAVGILLSAVVIVACVYVGAGVSALSKALVPQPSIGRIQILR